VYKKKLKSQTAAGPELLCAFVEGAFKKRPKLLSVFPSNLNFWPLRRTTLVCLEIKRPVVRFP
jgi:hypothetical protein